jgi:hypothetical protein
MRVPVIAILLASTALAAPISLERRGPKKGELSKGKAKHVLPEPPVTEEEPNYNVCLRV